jgi:hypothetical protein
VVSQVEARRKAALRAGYLKGDFQMPEPNEAEGLIHAGKILGAIADQVSLVGRFGVSVADLRKISQTFALDTTMMVISRPAYAASRIFSSLELMPMPIRPTLLS